MQRSVCRACNSQEENTGKSLISLKSQESLNCGNLKCKQTLKAKLAVSPYAMTKKYDSTGFTFQHSFCSNNTLWTQHLPCHFFGIFQLCPPVYFPDLQTNGNVIQTDVLSVWFRFTHLPGKWKADLTESDRRLFLQKRKKKHQMKSQTFLWLGCGMWRQKCLKNIIWFVSGEKLQNQHFGGWLSL